MLAWSEPQDNGRLRRQLAARRRELEPSGEHRVDHEGVPVEVDEEELPAAPDRADALADECLELGRRASHGQRRRGRGGPDLAAGERRVEGLGDDRQVW